MERYANHRGNSSVRGYSIGEAYIDVMFSSGAVYRYSYRSAGIAKVEEMKRLAVAGQGLNSYIMRHARFNYER
ncbi:MAG: hypothetical protein SOV56_04355 [Phascolarctobacterium sp.]|nr:hypothetical protein [Phascolarctobacterium sp.]